MELDPAFTYLSLIFECKDDCLTIIDSAHIKEMMKFTASAVDDPTWGRICTRVLKEKTIDGAGCSENAYSNLTRFIEP